MKHNWEYKRLGDLCNISSSRRVLQSDWKESGVPFYRAREIVKLSENGFVNNELFISENLYDELAKSGIPQAGDIMLSAVGTLGATYIVKPTDKFYYKDASVICLSKISDLQPKFLCYLFDSNIILHQIDRQAKGVTVGTITISNASKFKVPVPDYKVQERIVAELDKINETIEDCRELLRNLDALAQSLFYDTFGDPIKNPKKWPIKQLKALSSLITNGTTPKGGQAVYVDSGITFFRSQNVWRNRLVMDDVAYLDEATNATMRGSMLHHNDILITKTGRINTENSSLGRSALFTGEDNTANINGHVYLVRLERTINPRFVLAILLTDSYRDLIRRVCVGAIDKRQLNLSHIEQFPIILPPLSLQEQFAARIEQIEVQKKAVEQTIAELQTLLDSRMDYWFN